MTYALALATGITVGAAFALLRLPVPAPSWPGVVGIVGIVAGAHLIGALR